MRNEQKEAIRERLAAIESANAGRLTPDAVVEDARDPDSPLHDQFEWNESKAAYAQLLYQARTLISNVKVVFNTEKSLVKTVYYVRDPSAASNEQGYVSVVTLRSNAEMAHEAIANEFARAAESLRRARELARVIDPSVDVQAMLDTAIMLRDRFSAPVLQAVTA